MPQTECCVFHPEAVEKVLGKLAGDLELLKKWRSTGTKIIITDTRQTS